jgi:ketosteroid isomerase-like protein
MPENESERRALDAVRHLEEVRRAAIRENDADTMDRIIDPMFIYINHDGLIYDKGKYIAAVRSHELTYSHDFDLTETEYRVDGDVIILVGMMLGHARLGFDQQVYHLRNMRVWRARGDEWKLLAWQSSPYFRPPTPEQQPA